MLRGLEADVTLGGVVGDDADGREFKAELEKAGVDCRRVLVDSGPPHDRRKSGLSAGRSSDIRIKSSASIARCALPLGPAQSQALLEGLIEFAPRHQARA